MAKSDDGEFELILGNRQLVSVFLMVVILLGVFFSMGYIVGRNSSPGPATADANSHPTAAASKPIVVDSMATPAGIEGGHGKPSPVQGPAAQPEDQSPAQQREVKRAETRSPEPKREEMRPKPAEAELTHAAPGDEPRSGKYLQVVATTRPGAEIVAESLTKRSFHAMVTPVPGSVLYRVLVGPLKDAGDMADTRVRLESAGFKPIMRNY